MKRTQADAGVLSERCVIGARPLGGEMHGGNLVRFIYTDEAGTSFNEPVCVVAAIVVNADHQWRVLRDEIDRIKREALPAHLQENFVLHATEIFSGGKKVDREKWPLQDRLDFIKEVLCLPLVHDVPISFGIEFKDMWTPFDEEGDKRLQNRWRHLMAFAGCMERADLFLRKYLNGREDGTVVAENITI